MAFARPVHQPKWRTPHSLPKSRGETNERRVGCRRLYRDLARAGAFSSSALVVTNDREHAVVESGEPSFTISSLPIGSRSG
jgi:hypothetical protein